MSLFKGIAMAFSLFSKVPMPQFEWREENMRYMMCFFPIVGLVVGLVVAAWLWLAAVTGMNIVLMGAGIAVIPVAMTGGIHLDGFCDVVDAQASHADLERKQQILKDPHVGAFAIIAVTCYLIAATAIATELTPRWEIGVLLGCSYIVSRCLSGIATIMFPTSASKGMLSKFHESAAQKRVLAVLVIELVVCAGGMFAVSIFLALPMVVVALMCLVLLYPFTTTQFGGMSGDIAGAFLQVTELVMLIVLVIVSKVVVL